MRSPTASICALVGALLLSASAHGALTVGDGPPAHSGVDHSQFQEGDAKSYEAQREIRFSERRRARMREEVTGVLTVVVPVVLLVIVALIVLKTRKGTKRGPSDFHKLRKELKQAEARRRAGGPKPVLDPRQW